MKRRDPEGPTEEAMAGNAQKRAHVAGDALADARRRMRADPDYAARVRTELAQLEIARAVRNLRERRKLTQKQLADKLRTGQPSIARLESGKVVPKIDFLERIADVLGARLDVRFLERRASPT
jgi:ribosome-binding protein aMBF1 (putative translation factor)